ncbi:MAG: hypothetical protein Q7S28_03745 [bacterium]|nr:hypothetical protein [bacterium]
MLKKKKPNGSNEKMNIEKLAQMSQGEFTAIRGEAAEFRQETNENFRVMRNDMEAGFQSVSHGMKLILDKLNSLQNDVIETHDLRSRVERLEKKVGLAK